MKQSIVLACSPVAAFKKQLAPCKIFIQDFISFIHSISKGVLCLQLLFTPSHGVFSQLFNPLLSSLRKPACQRPRGSSGKANILKIFTHTIPCSTLTQREGGMDTGIKLKHLLGANHHLWDSSTAPVRGDRARLAWLLSSTPGPSALPVPTCPASSPLHYAADAHHCVRSSPSHPRQNPSLLDPRVQGPQPPASNA